MSIGIRFDVNWNLIGSQLAKNWKLIGITLAVSWYQFIYKLASDSMSIGIRFSKRVPYDPESLPIECFRPQLELDWFISDKMDVNFH